MTSGTSEKPKNLILLVEDNPTDELLTVRALKKNNTQTEIAVAHDGVEALDFIFCQGKYKDRNINDLPSFILLDLKLPKLSGLQVLKRIRENKQTSLIPVIVLTSSKEEKDLTESYKLGANSYVQKPVDFQKFSEVANQLGMYWFSVNELPRYDQKAEDEAQ